MYLLKLFATVSILKFCLTTSLKKTKSFSVKRDQKLIDVNYFVKNGINEAQCLGQCFQLPKCHSVNINKDQNICVVNFEVDRDEKNIVPESGWLYYENQDHTCLMKEFTVLKDQVIHTVPYWSAQWELSFEIKPTAVSGHIIHFLAREFGCCEPGHRQPLIFFHKGTTKIAFRQINTEKNNFMYNSEYDLQLNVYHTVKVTHKLVSDVPSEYQFRVELDGVVVYDVIKPSVAVSYPNIKVYVSKMEPASAKIRKFCFYNL